jgi:nicotinamide mononucleotide (NMN) deamidase PncC
VAILPILSPAHLFVAYFKGTVVSYANEVKENMLAVNHHRL